MNQIQVTSVLMSSLMIFTHAAQETQKITLEDANFNVKSYYPQDFKHKIKKMPNMGKTLDKYWNVLEAAADNKLNCKDKDKDEYKLFYLKQTYVGKVYALNTNKKSLKRYDLVCCSRVSKVKGGWSLSVTKLHNIDATEEFPVVELNAKSLWLVTGMFGKKCDEELSAKEIKRFKNEEREFFYGGIQKRWGVHVFDEPKGLACKVIVKTYPEYVLGDCTILAVIRGHGFSHYYIQVVGEKEPRTAPMYIVCLQDYRNLTKEHFIAASRTKEESLKIEAVRFEAAEKARVAKKAAEDAEKAAQAAVPAEEEQQQAALKVSEEQAALERKAEEARKRTQRLADAPKKSNPIEYDEETVKDTKILEIYETLKARFTGEWATNVECEVQSGKRLARDIGREKSHKKILENLKKGRETFFSRALKAFERAFRRELKEHFEEYNKEEICITYENEEDADEMVNTFELLARNLRTEIFDQPTDYELTM